MVPIRAVHSSSSNILQSGSWIALPLLLLTRYLVCCTQRPHAMMRGSDGVTVHWFTCTSKLAKSRAVLSMCMRLSRVHRKAVGAGHAQRQCRAALRCHKREAQDGTDNVTLHRQEQSKQAPPAIHTTTINPSLPCTSTTHYWTMCVCACRDFTAGPWVPGVHSDGGALRQLTCTFTSKSPQGAMKCKQTLSGRFHAGGTFVLWINQVRCLWSEATLW